jgi:hypothetical protein
LKHSWKWHVVENIVVEKGGFFSNVVRGIILIGQSCYLEVVH